MRLKELQEQMVSELYKPNTDLSLADFRQFVNGETNVNAQIISEEGWRLTHLILMKLRFEKLTRALPELSRLFEENSELFMKKFCAYHKAHPPLSFFPHEELDSFISFFHDSPRS
jgi:hypothetical protein